MIKGKWYIDVVKPAAYDPVECARDAHTFGNIYDMGLEVLATIIAHGYRNTEMQFNKFGLSVKPFLWKLKGIL